MQKMLISGKLKEKKLPPPPVKITLTRIAPRELDYDNLCHALKTPTDIVADHFHPGLAPGRADGFKDLEFQYSQKKGKPKEYGLIITICQKNDV